MTDCTKNCIGNIYHLENNCCKARWLSTSFAPHALAMLDTWQAKDAVVMGVKKSTERRKAVVKMAKDLSKAKNE